MLQVRQIVNRVFTSNTFVLSDDDFKTCWLVDVGDVKKVLDILPGGGVVKGVLLTHTHFDHIYGINELYRRFPEMEVCTSEYGSLALYSEKKNFSFYHEEPIVFEGKNVRVLQDGEEIELSPWSRLKVMATPGHCPSCLCYYNERMIFTGDSYIPEVAVVSKLPRGNKALATESKEKIFSLAKGKIIYPGHGMSVNG